MIAHHKASKNYYLSSLMAMVKAPLKGSKTTVIKTVSTEDWSFRTTRSVAMQLKKSPVFLQWTLT